MDRIILLGSHCRLRDQQCIAAFIFAVLLVRGLTAPYLGVGSIGGPLCCFHILGLGGSCRPCRLHLSGKLGGLRLGLENLTLGLINLVCNLVLAEGHLLLRSRRFGLLNSNSCLCFLDRRRCRLLLVGQVLLSLRKLAECRLVGGLRLGDRRSRTTVFKASNELTFFHNAALVSRERGQTPADNRADVNEVASDLCILR